MDPDQTVRMRRLVWIHAGRKPIMLVLSWRGSYVHYNYVHVVIKLRYFYLFLTSTRESIDFLYIRKKIFSLLAERLWFNTFGHNCTWINTLRGMHVGSFFSSKAGKLSCDHITVWLKDCILPKPVLGGYWQNQWLYLGSCLNNTRPEKLESCHMM
jgi:hypothetical protein